MMGYGWENMMGGGYAPFAFTGLILHLVLLIDAILLGIWLWKQIQKK